MTDQTQDHTAELERLRTHNAELLTELREARRGRTEAQDRVTELEGELNKANGTLRTITLDQPAEAAIAAAIEGSHGPVAPLEWAKDAIGRFYDIELRDGRPVFVTKDDAKKVIELTDLKDELRRAARDDGDKTLLQHILPATQGGGAGPGGTSKTMDDGKKQAQPQAPKFGIR